jgi:hypothetical protein
MKIVYGALLLCLFAYATPIDLAPKLSLYTMPEKLLKSVTWRKNAQLHASSAGLWLSTQGNLYRLDKPSKALMSPLHVNSFTLTQSAHPVAIVGEHLGLIRHGLFLPSLKLPESDYKLVSGPKDTLYLYHPTKPSPIYQFDGNLITPIAQPNNTVQALTYIGETLIFATKEGVFSLENGKPLGLIMPLPDFPPILSISANQVSAELFLSTEDTVYSVRDGLMTPLATGIGGDIAFYDNCIWIADANRQQLYILMPQVP